MAKDTKYRVTRPTGPWVEGNEEVTEEQAGAHFAKWVKSGALVEAKASQKEADEGTQDEPGSVSRSAALATGDIDAVSPPADNKAKGK